ncbi:hypothetical protein M3Y96_00296400 [Aphelenchoides besseyi]|nr:hypothetical protein M3Y96_00296400 [Aphelenchoides besseyi]
MERVDLTPIDLVHAFNAELVELYSQTSGTMSYESFFPIPMCTLRDPIFCEQDQRDQIVGRAGVMALLDGGSVPVVVDVDEQALERVNRRREERKTEDPETGICIEIAKSKNVNDKTEDAESDLLCNLIAEALNLALSDANVYGKSLRISIGTTSGNPQHRTVEMNSGFEKKEKTKEEKVMDLNAIRNVEDLNAVTDSRSQIISTITTISMKDEDRKIAQLGPPIHTPREIRRRTLSVRSSNSRGSSSESTAVSAGSWSEKMKNYVKKIWRR